MAETKLSAEVELADRAVGSHLSGADLPASLRDGIEVIRTAISHYEAGRTEKLRAELKKISIRSPFAEWALMLRGLSAWTRSDDEAARENWRRLDPRRKPARLIAPLRAAIDPEFRNAQSEAARTALAQRQEKLTNADKDLFPALRAIRAELNKEESLETAFRLARQIVSQLRKKHPDLLARLAECLYWRIYEHGHPDDLNRYRGAFGPPPQDPEFARLEAMVLENTGDLEVANRLWQRYSEWLTVGAKEWPPEQAALAGALIRFRMGFNAEQHAEKIVPEELEEGFDHFAEMLGMDELPLPREPLKPGAEECYREAMEMCPEWATPAISLMRVLSAEGATPKASKLAKTLRERFPTDVKVLEVLGDHYLHANDYVAASEVLSELHRRNPLDRSIKVRLGIVSLAHGRSLGVKGKYDEAKVCLEQALGSVDGPLVRAVRCTLSILELKQGNEAEATAQIEKASSRETDRPALVYQQLVEVIRFKLPQAVKKDFDNQFKEALSGSLTLPAATELLRALGLYQAEPPPYRGLKTHQKKITDALKKVIEKRADEEARIECGMLLWRMKIWRLLQTCAERGIKEYPKSPFFPWMLAERFIGGSERQYPTYRAVSQLNKAHTLLAARPDDERHRWLREQVSNRRRELERSSPFPFFGFDMFDEFGGPEDF